MTNVPARKRQDTDLLVLMKDKEIQEQVTAFVMNEKILPKKWRLAIGLDLIKKADELVDNLTYANSIKIENQETKNLRLKFQKFALANCFQLQNKLVRAEKCVETVKSEQQMRIAGVIAHEINLITAWIKSDGVNNTKNSQNEK